jgi:hypothetical protein
MPKAPPLKPWSVSTPVPAASFTTLLLVVVIVGFGHLPPSFGTSLRWHGFT